MKNILLYLFAIILVSSCTDNNSVKISGEVKNYTSDSISLVYTVNGQKTELKSAVKEGQFQFNPANFIGQSCRIGEGRNSVSLLIDNEDCKLYLDVVDGNIELVKTENCTSNDLELARKAHINSSKEAKELEEANVKCKELYTGADKEAYSKQRALTFEISDKYWDMVKTYSDSLTSANSNTVFAAYVYQRTHVAYKEFDTQEEIDAIRAGYKKLGEKAQNSIYPKMIEDYLAHQAKAIIGVTAPEIEGKGLNGEKVKLSDFRGSYVLLDFWSSWCGYCRMETPNIKKAIENYPDLKVLGVSFDTSKKAWKEAVAEDESTWNHLLPAKNQIKQIREDYLIRSIPHIILISPEGKVVKKRLRGEAIVNVMENL